MRLTISFVVLLLAASTATSLVFRNFSTARGGDSEARIAVFFGAPIALVALVLLSRIMLKVFAARRAVKKLQATTD